MSIQPPSDIVLDVARAADPATSLAATERLTKLSGPDAVATETFTHALGTVAADSVLRRAATTIGGSAQTVGGQSADPQLKVYKGLEAMILQNLVENMLPKDATDYFGTGSAGEIWRSMLAEQLGKRLSDRVNLGLAAKAAALHPPLAAKRVVGPGLEAATSAAIAGPSALRRGG